MNDAHARPVLPTFRFRGVRLPVWVVLVQITRFERMGYAIHPSTWAYVEFYQRRCGQVHDARREIGIAPSVVRQAVALVLEKMWYRDHGPTWGADDGWPTL